MKPIDHLIVCSPHHMPDTHYKYDRAKREHELVSGRRPAGYSIASRNGGFDDPGKFVEIDLVNRIRHMVDKWREAGYPGVTGITRQLLRFWRHGTDREYPFFFCQIEAMETLIWLTETNRAGINIPGDGGEFRRLCSKMATGAGKTVVMGMLIAWQAINKATYQDDPRFSSDILVVAPNLTVKSRLKVLEPASKDNCYWSFHIVPDSLYERLLQARVVIRNWHALSPYKDIPHNVVRLGPESDKEFAQRVLDFDDTPQNIVVINDEAHHAWRHAQTNPDGEEEKATVWIGGLDRIHRAIPILSCFDFSATPFVVSEKAITEDTLFGWIVSDFSLNDAIESGLVKTPRLPVTDDSNVVDDQNRSRFYHMYGNPEVRADLNQKSRPHIPLPDLVRNAFYFLGQDWMNTKESWGPTPVPPVMITVCNTTHTAARVAHSFRSGAFEGLEEISGADHILHIDSGALKGVRDIEDGSAKRMSAGTRQRAEGLLHMANTIGRVGEAGGRIRNVISVQMLSEGWDARTVTQIMGLRAFSSQLLCEQVVGRGLRRRSYEINPETGLLEPEYVSVFGIPFTFLPHEEKPDTPKPELPTTKIEPDPEKARHEIVWPNVDRIETTFVPRLDVDWNTMKKLRISSGGISTTVGMAHIIDDKPVSSRTDVDLQDMDRRISMHRMIFVAAKDVFRQVSPGWEGSQEILLLQVIRIMEKFMESKYVIVDDISKKDKLRRKMAILLNLKRVSEHVFWHIKDNGIREARLVFGVRRTKSTGDMQPWYTRKMCGEAAKSHINHAVYDSAWEAGGGEELERNCNVISWARNARLGFVVRYMWHGVIHEYWPDYLVRLKNGTTLVLEMKGRDDEQNKEKRRALEEWVRAVNQDGRFGVWACDVAFHPSQVRCIIDGHAASSQIATVRAKCPSCMDTADTWQAIQDRFGFRTVSGVVRPQSWCRRCRKRHGSGGMNVTPNNHGAAGSTNLDQQ